MTARRCSRSSACTPRYGPTRVLHGIELRVERGLDHDPARRQRRRQDDDAARALRHGPAAGRDPLSPASASTRRATEDIVRLGIAHVPDGRGTFVNLIDRGEPAPGRLRPRDRAAVEQRLRAHLRLLPAPEGAAPPAGRHAVGRRAADARGVARADAAAAPAAARRAFVRPGAADRARDLRHHARDQPAASRSASCWSSRTRRWRSTWPTTPTCSRPGASCSRAAPSEVKQQRRGARARTSATEDASRSHGQPSCTRSSPASPPAASTPASRWRW